MWTESNTPSKIEGAGGADVPKALIYVRMSAGSIWISGGERFSFFCFDGAGWLDSLQYRKNKQMFGGIIVENVN